VQGEYPVLATLSGSYPKVKGRLLTCYSPVRRSSTPEGAFPLDLHVLSTPPAFVLSQDQTLHRKPKLQQKTNPSQKTTTSNRQNHRSSTQKETTTTTKQPTNRPPSHGDRIIQTNSSTNTLLSSQKSDAQQLRPVKGFVESWVGRLGAGSPTVVQNRRLASRRSLATRRTLRDAFAASQIGVPPRRCDLHHRRPAGLRESLRQQCRRVVRRCTAGEVEHLAELGHQVGEQPLHTAGAVDGERVQR
jgi:hypothetical protein